jgi:hypothetical protein
MFKFLRKHHTFVFVSLALVIIALPFFGIGGMTFFSPQDGVAKVNGQKITQRGYDQIYHNLLRQKDDITAEQKKQLGMEALQELIREEVMYQEAMKYGIRVPDQEIQLQLINAPAFQKDGRFDIRTYGQTLAQVFRMTPEEFEEMRRKESAAVKLNQLILGAVHVSDDVVQSGLANRISIETDAKKKKELKDNPEIFRNELRQREMSKVFTDWLGQINRNLKVEIISNSLKAQLSGK